MAIAFVGIIGEESRIVSAAEDSRRGCTIYKCEECVSKPNYSSILCILAQPCNVLPVPVDASRKSGSLRRPFPNFKVQYSNINHLEFVWDSVLLISHGDFVSGESLTLKST